MGQARSMARRATKRRKRRRERLMEELVSDLWLKELRLAGCQKAERVGTCKNGAVSLDKDGSHKMLIDWDIVKMMWVISTRKGREYHREFAEVQRRVREWLDEPEPGLSDPMLRRFQSIGARKV